jgi:hypothetical protein
MSQWHNEHPELVGTDADPWMIHADYRAALHYVPDSVIWAAEEERDSRVCSGCGHRYGDHDPDPPGGGCCEVAGCGCQGHYDDHVFS